MSSPTETPYLRVPLIVAIVAIIAIVAIVATFIVVIVAVVANPTAPLARSRIQMGSCRTHQRPKNLSDVSHLKYTI